MMNDDLIKRSDAIGAITNHCENECYYRIDNWCPQCQREEFQEAIKAVPSADRPQKWIPCSERLPKVRESVLLAVNHKCGDWIGEGCYWETTENHTIWKGYRWNATYWDDEIVAWMPLPKPYREEK